MDVNENFKHKLIQIYLKKKSKFLLDNVIFLMDMIDYCLKCLSVNIVMLVVLIEKRKVF